MSISQDQVVDYIKNLRLAEVKALIEILEDRARCRGCRPRHGNAAPWSVVAVPLRLLRRRPSSTSS